jgi:hypothetical protein
VARRVGEKREKDVSHPDVRDNADRRRFELIEDVHLAFADYRIDGTIITFTQTVVPSAIGGGASQPG